MNYQRGSGLWTECRGDVESKKKKKKQNGGSEMFINEAQAASLKPLVW